MSTLQLAEANFHEVRVEDRRLILLASTTSLFEADAVSARIIDLLRERGPSTEDQIVAADGVTGEELRAALNELCMLGIVANGEPGRTRELPAISQLPLNTLVLNVTTGCNLSCTYCYKEDLANPARASRMDFETAAAAIELFLTQSGGGILLNIVLFGGEPLTNLPLIRQVVEYAERRCGEIGREPNFSLTTNGILLDDDTADYLDAHRFGITVSIDGPPEFHDLNRRTVGGKGTYEMVARNVIATLARYKSKPVGARVTLASGVTDVETIFDHLKYDLGFAEVGFAPVTAADDAHYGLSAEQMQKAFAGMVRLGERYRDAALSGRFIGFSNIHHLMGDLHRGTHKSLPCGAGAALLAVDHEGKLNLCHRFTGSDLPAFGNLADGIDRSRLRAFLERARDLTGSDCERCYIRGLCSGGCYHERYRRFGDVFHPSYHYCILLREWVEFAIGAYATIANHSPTFFEHYIDAGRYSEMRGLP